MIFVKKQKLNMFQLPAFPLWNFSDKAGGMQTMQNVR